MASASAKSSRKIGPRLMLTRLWTHRERERESLVFRVSGLGFRVSDPLLLSLCRFCRVGGVEGGGGGRWVTGILS